MQLAALHIRDYRSIRRLWLEVGNLTTILGPNGSGKSNLYKALILVAACARGDLARTLAAEGGMASALWAGPRKKESVRMNFAVTLGDWRYEIECGLPVCTQAALPLDPVVKSETVSLLRRGRSPVAMMKRDGPHVTMRNNDGKMVAYPIDLFLSETALAAVQSPSESPEIATLAQALRGWRFYHHFRTDLDSPIRQPQVGVLTPMMSSDGSDLAATLRSVAYVSESHPLDLAVEEAFPGSRLEIADLQGRLEIGLRTPGLMRALTGAELSDGTLRYLCLIGALMSLRLPPLIVLNEPETSLHPDLLRPLARLIHQASRRTQVWVVTHSAPLAAFIAEFSGVTPLSVSRENGETRVAGTVQDNGNDELRPADMRYDLDMVYELSCEVGMPARRDSADRVEIDLGDGAVLCFVNAEREADCLIGFLGMAWHTHNNPMFSDDHGHSIEVDYLDLVTGLTDGRILLCERELAGSTVDRWLEHSKINDLGLRFMEEDERIIVRRAKVQGINVGQEN